MVAAAAAFPNANAFALAPARLSPVASMEEMGRLPLTLAPDAEGATAGTEVLAVLVVVAAAAAKGTPPWESGGERSER